MPQSEKLPSPWVAITQHMIDVTNRELSEAYEDYRVRLATLKGELKRLKQLLREAPHAAK